MVCQLFHHFPHGCIELDRRYVKASAGAGAVRAAISKPFLTVRLDPLRHHGLLAIGAARETGPQQKLFRIL